MEQAKRGCWAFQKDLDSLCSEQRKSHGQFVDAAAAGTLLAGGAGNVFQQLSSCSLVSYQLVSASQYNTQHRKF